MKKLLNKSLLLLAFSCLFINASAKNWQVYSGTDLKEVEESAQAGDSIFCYGIIEGELVLKHKNDLAFIGKDCFLYTNNSSSTVIQVVNCENIKFEGFYLSHYEAILECEGNCVDIFHSKKIHFSNCDVSGSGYIGFNIKSSEKVLLTSNTIHNCTAFGVDVSQSEVQFWNNTFFHNGQNDEYHVYGYFGNSGLDPDSEEWAEFYRNNTSEVEKFSKKKWVYYERDLVPIYDKEKNQIGIARPGEEFEEMEDWIYESDTYGDYRDSYYEVGKDGESVGFIMSCFAFRFPYPKKDYITLEQYFTDNFDLIFDKTIKAATNDQVADKIRLRRFNEGISLFEFEKGNMHSKVYQIDWLYIQEGWLFLQTLFKSFGDRSFPREITSNTTLIETMDGTVAQTYSAEAEEGVTSPVESIHFKEVRPDGSYEIIISDIGISGLQIEEIIIDF